MELANRTRACKLSLLSFRRRPVDPMDLESAGGLEAPRFFAWSLCKQTEAFEDESHTEQLTRGSVHRLEMPLLPAPGQECSAFLVDHITQLGDKPLE